MATARATHRRVMNAVSTSHLADGEVLFGRNGQRLTSSTFATSWGITPVVCQTDVRFEVVGPSDLVRIIYRAANDVDGRTARVPVRTRRQQLSG